MVDAPPSEEARAAARTPATERPLALVAVGLAVTLGNPKVMIFYLALLPTLLDLRSVSLLGHAELVVGCGMDSGPLTPKRADQNSSPKRFSTSSRRAAPSASASGPSVRTSIKVP